MSSLEVSGVWKSFPSWEAGSRTLRATLARRSPMFLRRGPRRWALQDVSVHVAAGESMGVIGHNGAGKSTMLRVASGLSRPTRGTVRVPPRTVSVLSLGSWFDPLLTGRENAMTAAIVLGQSRAQARNALPAIFEFAEIENFADAPVRVYSDGMRLRLAFGVLAQLDPELLLIDEALAVGDVSFQAKCVERIRLMRANGAAIVIASHDLGQVAIECDRALWLHAGRVRGLGAAAEVVAAYREAGRAETLARTPAATRQGALTLGVNRFGSQEVTLENVAVEGSAIGVTPSIRVSGSLSVSMTVTPQAAGLAAPVLLASIVRLSDEAVCAECPSSGLQLGALDQPADVTLTIDRLDLTPGAYSVDVGVYPPDWEYAYDFHWQVHRFDVTGESGGQGMLRPPHRWTRGGTLPRGP